MRNTLRCSTQNLLITFAHVVKLFGNISYKRRLHYGQDRKAYTTLLSTAAVSSHRTLTFGSALLTTKHCNLATHSVHSLHQSCCWNFSMLLDFVLLGVTNNSKRSCTFDLWGILSQYKPSSRRVNLTVVNSQSDRTSLAEVRVRTTAWFLGCSSFHYLCNKRNVTDGKEKSVITREVDSEWEVLREHLRVSLKAKGYWKLLISLSNIFCL